MRVLSGNDDFSDSLTGSATHEGDVVCQIQEVFVEPPRDEDLVDMLTDDRKPGLMQPLQEELMSGVQSLCALVGEGELDLLEVCAPWDAPLSAAVRNAGGKAMAVGLHNGYDLTTLSGFRAVAELIRKRRPFYVHFSPPCDPWSPFQNCNQRTEGQVTRLQLKRNKSRRLLRNCKRLMEIQLYERNGECGMSPEFQISHAGGERPLHAQSWKLPEMQAMTKLCGSRFTVHGCRHGLISKGTGQLVKKPWGWFSTMPEIKEALSLVCNHGPKAHPVIQGSDTAATAIYPPLLCFRFARVLVRQKQKMFSLFSGFDVSETDNQPGFGIGEKHFEPHGAILANHERENGVSGQNQENENEGNQEQPPANRVDGLDPEGSRDSDDPQQGDGDLREDGLLDDPQKIRDLLKTVHRNLGHPGNDAMKRMLRDSGAPQKVLDEVDNFQCPHCLQRGRRSPTRPAIIPRVYEKWQCVSVDTFWWHTPKEALNAGEEPEYILGISMMDEATDYHCAIIVRKGNQPLRNMAGQEFKEGFSKGWLQSLPAPSLLRYDEEGFLRKLEVVSWLETLGIKLEPIAGESAWQVGKHSKHLQTLKEQMSLLAMELGKEYSAEEILGLAVSAKNNLHNIRGYTPNQWAFGQNHSRISSFLQQYQNLPLQSARGDWSFEENVQTECRAQRLFLQVDAKRRLMKALNSRCRPLREFTVGDLVYYFRKGVGQGSRYGGTWYGPARVLSHEKTGDFSESQHPGSVIWISHAGKLLRCSPEQLRHVMHDVRHLDRQINGPQNFHTLLSQISGQQKYLDISDEIPDEQIVMGTPEEMRPHFRAQGKRPLSELRRSSDNLPSDHGPQEERDDAGPTLPEDSGEEQTQHRLLEDGSGGTGTGSARGRPQEPGEDLQGDLRERRLLQPVGSQSCGGRSHERQGSATLLPLPVSTSQGRRESTEGRSAPRKRTSSVSVERHRLQEQGDISQGRGESPFHEEGSTGRAGRRGSGLVEQGGGDRSEHADDASQHARHEPADVTDREHSESVGGIPSTRIRSSTTEPVRLRSRSPYPLRTESRAEMHGTEDSSLLIGAVKSTPSKDNGLQNFVSYINHLEVVEMEFVLAPRDVHKQKGCWVLNQKAKKNAEVVLRKLCKEDLQQFEAAMDKELDSFLSADAVQICGSHGIPQERIMQMRWIYTWKPLTDEDGNVNGQKAKARLIVKGFQDPRLMNLPREAPTLSCLGRNLLLANASRYRMPVCSGDTKTAFLQGGDAELKEDIYGMPPPEVRKRLKMKDDEILRIVRAIYGLLNAPKKWYESLSQFLISDGWVLHGLDKCLFKRIDPKNNCVVGFLGVHVDDILCAGNGPVYDEAIQRLRTRFPFGAWECALETSLTYCGCEVKQVSRYQVHLSQERFALSVDEINLSNERKLEVTEEVSFPERKAMRQVLGALNWRATQSAPWLLSTVSHLQGCIESASVQDILSLNKLVRLQRRYFNQGLHFPNFDGDVMIVSFTDASWATRRDGSSQGGQITLMMGKNVINGAKTPFSVLSWSSRRLRRVARSSTSAEAQMTANTLDFHEFAKLAWIDLDTPNTLSLKHADEYLSQHDSVMVCDARNIFDGVVKVETSGLHMEEKRTAIELLAIKERLGQARVSLRWVDGDQELADGLTKPWRHDPLIKALHSSQWRIVYDPEFQSARRKRALRYQNPNAVVDQYWLHCLFSLDSTWS